jgi:peptidoglycan-associated lipoprotein
MRTHRAAVGYVAALAVASLSLLPACAASKPATAGAATPTTATGASQVGPAAQSVAPPTSGTVAISEEIRRACGIADQDAYFAFDSSTILTMDVAPLSAVARCFSAGPLKGRSMRLVGHADPRGSSEYNLTLGQGRADSVQGYLDRHGVERSRIGTTSRGAIDATGTDESGWAHDRRVDVMLGS